MYPVLFHVFGIPIEAFWATVFLGFAASLLVVRAELLRLGHDAGGAYDLILWAYVGGFVGARLLLVVTAWDDFQRDPFEHLFSGSGWVLLRRACASVAGMPVTRQSDPSSAVAALPARYVVVPQVGFFTTTSAFGDSRIEATSAWSVASWTSQDSGRGAAVPGGVSIDTSPRGGCRGSTPRPPRPRS